MRLRACSSALTTAALTVGLTAAATPAGAAEPRPFLDRLHTVSPVASTVPDNGDVNPYGTFTIRESAGDLHRGNVLVSNFNNSNNLQGTGTTLVQITPDGTRTTFATIDPAHLPGPCPGGVGLTTALTVLPGGWVVVGSLPTSDGTAGTAQAGCLLVLDKHGTVRETIAGDGINGPWDMTAVSTGKRSELFVTNVLNGTVAANGAEVDQGTVLRITLCTEGDEPPTRAATTVIGSGFPERTDPAALVVGPTGVGLHDGTLYVADAAHSRITAIPHALTREDSAGIGRVVTSGGSLNAPLGMAITPRGDILTVNGGDGDIVETDRAGRQVAAKQINDEGTPAGAGALFGLALDLDHDAVYFVNDADNALDVLH
ncbi:hypothetical protein PUR71_01160 [Streptomyces sp. SP17BM10]|uniref:hypothetical protein n=1 Tax=Streptomyces sp. SP17BM10 TaxID=3002530 RepID=UPI002E7690F1|nr:hypothetical protein [Streptomyces sp. SP17BM10]MEE1781552.1 hypothetical protein [Streptomyces sp. SP17BM10]